MSRGALTGIRPDVIGQVLAYFHHLKEEEAVAENRGNEGGSPSSGTVESFNEELLPEKALARIYLVTIVILGLTVLTSIVGAIWLSLVGQEIPDLLVSLGSAAIGALAGLLAPSAGG